jgi:hypothetical protein
MSLVRFKGQNHPQQVGKGGANPTVDERATTPEVFAELHERFNFTVDACALARNAKLPRYWTPEQDGLAMNWTGERVWCNPPYSSIEPWVIKAKESAAELVVLLLPANRTEQRWWQEHIEPVRDNGGGDPCRVSSGSNEVHQDRRHRGQAQRTPAVRCLSRDRGC